MVAQFAQRNFRQSRAPFWLLDLYVYKYFSGPLFRIDRSILRFVGLEARIPIHAKPSILELTTPPSRENPRKQSGKRSILRFYKILLY